MHADVPATRPSDPRVPAREDCVLRYVLDRRAAETPERVALICDQGPDQPGDAWSWADLAGRVRRAAAGLAALGVRQGDHVLVWLPTGPTMVVAWYAINYLGAVYVPMNTGYRGSLLKHALWLSDARLAIVHHQLAPRLAEVDTATVAAAVICGAAPSGASGLAEHLQAVLEGEGAPPALERPIEPWDVHALIYTSGTTGPSKGVLQTWCQLYTMAEPYRLLVGITPDDRLLANLPLFHVGGTCQLLAALFHGASATLIESFKTEDFWPMVRRTGTTVGVMLAAMTSFLMAQPRRNDDHEHPLRTALIVPFDDAAMAVHERFGCDVFTVFNMTEISSPLFSSVNPVLRGLAGRPRPGMELRIVDANDCEVPVEAVGELVVRTDRPWALNAGYHKNPEATARAWRNGWFHTGDAFRRDAEGNFFFVDRIKDAIRRRGENISSFEVESEVCAFPGVREAAAVAVPSPLGEDEVLVALSLAEGVRLDPAELLAFLTPRMAHFMLPRYIRVLPDLPKTPTAKVQKHLIRGDGLTADTWDREAAGIVVRRDRLTAV